MTLFVCGECGHVAVGGIPDKCPACEASKSEFTQNDNVFKDAEEKSKEGAVKHIPSIKVSKECGMIPENDCIDVLVRIGETLHPMTSEHFIQWIDCYVDGKYMSRIQLTADMNPAVVFHLKNVTGKIEAVAMCNLHGHWFAEVAI